MDYHTCNRSQDDIIQIHVDGSEFIKIEEKWPHFKEETQNIRLSLATDGVNPFGEIRSVWSIFFIKNNLPPWMSIKREHIMLEMIFLGILLFYFYLHVIISLGVK